MKDETPYFKKGTKFFCQSCGDLLFTTTCDVFVQEMIHESMFEGGQEFKNGERMKCKKCFEHFYLTYEHFKNT